MRDDRRCTTPLGVLLPNPVISHRDRSVASSRVRHGDSIRSSINQTIGVIVVFSVAFPGLLRGCGTNCPGVASHRAGVRYSHSHTTALCSYIDLEREAALMLMRE
jgi:hypothetical protein